MTNDLQEYKSDLKQFIAEGQTIGQIAEFYNISKPTLYKDLRELGLNPPKSKNSPIVDLNRLQKMLKYLRKPRTCDELCSKFNISLPTLYRDFRRLDSKGHPVVRWGFSRPAKYKVDEK